MKNKNNLYIAFLFIFLVSCSNNNETNNKVDYSNNNSSEKLDITPLVTSCFFYGKEYNLPINAHCLPNDKYSAWKCDN
jgi:hypothetical protein